MAPSAPAPLPANRLVIVIVFVAAVLLLLAARACQRWLVRYRLRRRWAHARCVERQASRMLEGLGYAILGRQIETSYAVLVDGQPAQVRLRADYLVSRAGRQFVAEVKSGAVAPRLDTAATRRQLLEYRVAFQVDGVLLVDGEQARVHEVTFPTWPLPAREVRPARLALYLIMALLVTIGLWALSRSR